MRGSIRCGLTGEVRIVIREHDDMLHPFRRLEALDAASADAAPGRQLEQLGCGYRSLNALGNAQGSGNWRQADCSASKG